MTNKKGKSIKALPRHKKAKPIHSSICYNPILNAPVVVTTFDNGSVWAKEGLDKWFPLLRVTDTLEESPRLIKEELKEDLLSVHLAERLTELKKENKELRKYLEVFADFDFSFFSSKAYMRTIQKTVRGLLHPSRDWV